MRLKERANKLKKDVPAVFLALKDKDTPVIAKVLAAIAGLHMRSRLSI